MNGKRIAIMGTDAVGIIVGALLSRVGFLVDIIALDGQTASNMLPKGATITGSLEIYQPLIVRNCERLYHTYDVLLLMCDPLSVKSRYEKMTPYLDRSSVICFLSKEGEEIDPVWEAGIERLVVGTAFISAEWEDASTVYCSSSPRHLVYDHIFEVGTLDNSITPQLLAVKTMLESIGLCSVRQGEVRPEAARVRRDKRPARLVSNSFSS